MKCIGERLRNEELAARRVVAFDNSRLTKLVI